MKHYKYIAIVLAIGFTTVQTSYADLQERILIKNTSDATIVIINADNHTDINYGVDYFAAPENQTAILPHSTTYIDSYIVSTDGGGLKIRNDSTPVYTGTFLIKCPGTEGNTNYINYALTLHEDNSLSLDFSHVYPINGSPLCVHVPQAGAQIAPDPNHVNEVDFTN